MHALSSAHLTWRKSASVRLSLGQIFEICSFWSISGEYILYMCM